MLEILVLIGLESNLKCGPLYSLIRGLVYNHKTGHKTTILCPRPRVTFFYYFGSVPILFTHMFLLMGRDIENL